MPQQTVLLIDNDADSVMIYGIMLQHLGYRVLSARSPDEGIGIAREQQPDLIITALFLRTETGWYTPERLKADPRTAHIPLLAVSAQAFPEDRERALHSGCDHFMAKPLTPVELGLAAEVMLTVEPAEQLLAEISEAGRE